MSDSRTTTSHPRQPSAWINLRASGGAVSILIALAFFALAALILSLGEQVVPYRPGQFVDHDIVARIDFVYKDIEQFTRAQRDAWRDQARIYKASGDNFKSLEDLLMTLPDKVGAAALDDLPPVLRNALDSGAVTALQQLHTRAARQTYHDSVKAYIQSIRDLNPVILAENDRQADLANKFIILPAIGSVRTDTTYCTRDDDDLRAKLAERSRVFMLSLQPMAVSLTRATLQPTHIVDQAATTEEKNRAARQVPATAADVQYRANMVLVSREQRVIHEKDWHLLRAENEQFIASLDRNAWKSRLGRVAVVLLVTIVLAGYIARFQPRIVRNHARGVAFAALLLATLLIGQLAGIGSSHLYLFGVAPTILAAMILTIAYDQRFAVGVSMLQATLVTAGLGQPIGFYVIILVGVLTCCFLLDDIRSRSKLVEVGGATSLAMILASCANGLILRDPLDLIARDCLFVGAGGLAVGFIVLGILPFIEKAFRITTSMTLLELADASQPLLRKLALEAPGTYNHSLQVGTLAEAAAEAIHANSLLCRVGSYYHDIGKTRKPDYFVENQSDGQNRHIHLSPNVSLAIIIGHVKDGLQLAREHHLPTSLLGFIHQHHGTTLVEYFYHRARTQHEAARSSSPPVTEDEYRYPGPKPKSREAAVVMMADAVESATRAIEDPTPQRVEALVHQIAMKRLLDGQFDECDLTMRDLEHIEQALIKTLMSIYHGRIAYPSSQSIQKLEPAVKSA